MSKLYLHIGLPKTGTTYIQNFLRKNNAVLMEHGCIYPEFGYRFPSIGANRNAHFLCNVERDENGERNREREKVIEENCFTQLLECFKEYEKVIISDEQLWNSAEYKRDKFFWKDLRKRIDGYGVELKVIVYLRRQDSFIQSFWAQQVKENGYTLSLKEYTEDRRFGRIKLDYCKRLEKIAKFVGKENLLVRVYEKGQYEGGSLISDFLYTVGLSYYDSFEELEKPSNRSISGIYLATRQELNAIEEFRTRKSYALALLKRVADEQGELKIKGDNNYFTYEDDVSFLSRYAESNKKVARVYLGREDGVLFREKPEKEEFRTEDYEISDYVKVLGRMISLQQEKNNELRVIIAEKNAQLRDKQAEIKVLNSTIKWVTTPFPKKVIRKLRRIFSRKEAG